MRLRTVPEWQTRWSRLVDRIRVVDGAADEVQLLHELSNIDQTCVVAFVNAHAMNCAAADSGFFDALMDAEVLLRDGSGMAHLYHRVGRPAGLNMNGTDFIPKLLAAAQGRRVAFWGTQEPYLSVAVGYAQLEWSANVVSAEHGFHGDEHYVQCANALQLDIAVLGMGMPKQERVALLVRQASVKPMLVVCGGAIIDFMGGKARRAPKWMRNVGLEWLYRLVLEPVRLFKRYIIGIPQFLFRLRQWSIARPRK